VDVDTYYASDVQEIFQLQRHAIIVENLYQKIAFYSCSNNYRIEAVFRTCRTSVRDTDTGLQYLLFNSLCTFEVMCKSHHRNFEIRFVTIFFNNAYSISLSRTEVLHFLKNGVTMK